MPIHGAGGQVEGVGDLRHAHADEIPQAHHLGGLRVLVAQGRQGVADRDEFVRRHGDGDTGFVEFHIGEMAAVLDALFAPGVVDENLLHGGGRRFEEMTAVGERRTAIPGDLEPCFMHQCRRLQGMPSLLLGQPGSRQVAQFAVNLRKQLVGGRRIARFNGAQHLGDVGHGMIVPNRVPVGES